MKALVCTNPLEVTYRDEPEPALAANEVVLKIDAVGMTRPGAFAERMSIPTSSLIEIPPDMTPVMAALTEPAATALHAMNLSTRDAPAVAGEPAADHRRSAPRPRATPPSRR